MISLSRIGRPRFFSLITLSGASLFLLVLLIICSYLLWNDRTVLSPMLNFDLNFLQPAAVLFSDAYLPIS